MQVIITTLLFFLLAFPVCGKELPVLLPEWQSPAGEKQLKEVLLHWHFSDWGRRPAGRKNTGRSHSAALAGGKVQITLENPDVSYSANMFSRSLLLPQEEKKLYRLKVTAVNGVPGKALIRLQMLSSGTTFLSARHYFSVSGTPEEKELSITVPSGSKKLQLFLTLLGPGKVTFSDLQLTAEPPPPPSSAPGVPAKAFSLPEKTPVELPILFPAGFNFTDGSSVVLTLPWGVRLIGVSRGSRISRVDVKVKKQSVVTLEALHRNSGIRRITLLLGSDLPPSEKLLTASVQLRQKDLVSSETFFRLRVVKDIEALAPRYFGMSLTVPENAVPLESVPELENSLLRSGANFLVVPRLQIPPGQLTAAKVRQRVCLNLPPVRSGSRCRYETIRNESFWQQTFLPQIRKQILRLGSSRINAIITDSFLGQRKAVMCLCVLCRTELAEFSSRIPRTDAMNSSQGILEMRYARELKMFRKERQSSLWAGAKLNLPVERGGFRSRPALIPLLTVGEALSKKNLRGSEFVVDLMAGPILADGVKYDPAVNFLLREKICTAFRRNNPGALKLTARLSPHPGVLTAGELEFELLNLFFCGFSGVWLNLSPGADHSSRLAFARAALCLREYESFFRSSRLQKHGWILKSDLPPIELPPVPGTGGYVEVLPPSVEQLRLLVWKQGPDTLAAVGNFGSEAASCTLQNLSAPLKWQGQVNGMSLSGAQLRNSGAELTVPPRAWVFLKFEKL